MLESEGRVSGQRKDSISGIYLVDLWTHTEISQCPIRFCIFVSGDKVSWKELVLFHCFEV